MIVRDIATVNLLGCDCDDCPLPGCPAPIIETMTPCGYPISGIQGYESYFGYVYHTDGLPPPELAGRNYKKVTITRISSYTFEGDDYETGNETCIRIYSKSLVEASCQQDITGSAEWSVHRDYAPPDPAEGDYLVSYSRSGSCGPGLDSCGGTETYTYSESPPDTNDTGSLDIPTGGETSSAWVGPIFTSLRTSGSVEIKYEDLVMPIYRFGLPPDFSTEEIPRSTYEVRCDEYFFPATWDAWHALKTAWRVALAAHREWEAAPVDTRGDEPEVPADPGAAPEPLPALLASREWIWDGTEENDHSEYVEMEPRPMDSPDGEVRRVNLAVICWRSARIGTKPSIHGEQYQPI